MVLVYLVYLVYLGVPFVTQRVFGTWWSWKTEDWSGCWRVRSHVVSSPACPCLVFLSYVICHLYVFLNLLNLNIGDTSLNDKFLTTTCHASYICFHVISHQVVSSPSCLLLPSDLILPVPSPPSPIIQQTFRKIRNFLTNAWGQSQVGDID